MLGRPGDLAEASQAFPTVRYPKQMPTDPVVVEEPCVGVEPVANDRRSFGRLVDLDEEERRGLASVDCDDVVRVDAPAEVGDEVLGPPELNEPRIVADERGDELDAVERVAGCDESRRSIGVEMDTSSSG
jgi:hypothetical protein